MLFKFNTTPTAGYFEKRGKIATAGMHSPSTMRRKIITADSGYSAGFGGSDGIVDRYNPIRDRLDEGSIVEEWLPRDSSGLDDMFRLMYHRDQIAGPIVDLLAEKSQVFQSKGEARRMLKENGVSVNKDKIGEDAIVNTSFLLNDKYILVQKGKKNYFLIKVI